MRVRCNTLFLDEAGHVYLPLAGPGETCLRLNGTASRLWRGWIGADVDRTAMPAVDAAFFDRLVAQGLLVATNRD